MPAATARDDDHHRPAPSETMQHSSRCSGSAITREPSTSSTVISPTPREPDVGQPGHRLRVAHRVRRGWSPRSRPVARVWCRTGPCAAGPPSRSSRSGSARRGAPCWRPAAGRRPGAPPVPIARDSLRAVDPYVSRATSALPAAMSRAGVRGLKLIGAAADGGGVDDPGGDAEVLRDRQALHPARLAGVVDGVDIGPGEPGVLQGPRRALGLDLQRAQAAAVRFSNS